MCPCIIVSVSHINNVGSHEGDLDFVYVAGKKPVRIPAGSWQILTGLIRQYPRAVEKVALLEELREVDGTLPKGIIASPRFVTVAITNKEDV